MSYQNEQKSKFFSLPGQTAYFQCPIIECAQLVFNRPEPGCVLQNSLDSCCPVSKVCKPEEVAKLHKCYYNGTEYHLGQTFSPQNAPCYSCICDTDFYNSTSISANKHCRKVDCGIELRHLDSVRNGCVPVYYINNDFCPLEFRCRKCTRDT